MSATGIGAAVRRKEDQRFITGKGHYTDDVNRPGQCYAYFLRSPHAHARIKTIDSSGRGQNAGRARGSHRRRACRRQDRQSHLRLDDHVQRRLADEDGAASGARAREGELRRRRGRRRRRRDAGAGQGRRREGQGRLRAAARGDRSGQGAGGGRAANPRGRGAQHHLSMAPGRSEGRRSRVQVGKPRHQARLHQQSPGAQCDRAARRDRRIRCRHRRPHALEHDAESARRAAGHFRLRRHRARAQAARDRARRRRRLRLEDLHLSGGGGLPLGGAQESAGR